MAELNSPALSGFYSAEEALAALLAGSGLRVERTATGVLMIRRDSKPSSAPPTTQISATRRQAWACRDSAANSSCSAVPAASEAEVLVTGTRIKGVAPVGSPLWVIDSATIRESGYSTTEQLLQALPQNFRGGQAGAIADVNMSTGSLNRLNSTAGSGVNLRGLGAASTLVLINGRRMSGSVAGTFTDISVIPVRAIERIEILADGASAIYGTDAIAGVINILLKRDYDGAESRVGYAAATGRSEVGGGHTIGATWGGGNLTLIADYLEQSPLLASERGYTADIPAPSSVFPSNRRWAVIGSARQRLAERWSVDGDVQYMQSSRHLIDTINNSSEHSFIEPVRVNGAIGLQYAAFSDWTLSLDGAVSGESTDIERRTTGASNDTQSQLQRQAQWSTQLSADGSLVDLPAGALRFAVGGAYRVEKYRRSFDNGTPSQDASRSVTSGYVELHAPLIRSLELSIAGRFDDYSDFGGTSNPKIGLAWVPTEGLTLRASYSTSFRAPAAGQELLESNSGVRAIDLLAFSAPGGNGSVPVALLFGSDRLRPEQSTHWTLGVTWQADAATGPVIAVSWYDVSYTDRIVVPPYDLGALADPALQGFVQRYDSPAAVAQLVDAYLERGAVLGDFTEGEFGNDPLSQTTTVYRYLWANAERTDVSGFDLGVGYSFEHGADRFKLGLNANYIHRMSNVPTPGASSYDLVDSFGNPADLRLRASASWARGAFDGALHLNYTDDYQDTSGQVARRAASYTTVDAMLRYVFGTESPMNGVSAALLVTNFLDTAPPWITDGGGAHYDAANATPLERSIGLELNKRWGG